jgi:hypothetical protein
MRRSVVLMIVPLLAAVPTAASADCTCRFQGRNYDVGQNVCMGTPSGARIATCGMVLNNTSWQFSETPCVVSAAPVEPPAKAAAQDHATHSHSTHSHATHRHGG